MKIQNNSYAGVSVPLKRTAYVLWYSRCSAGSRQSVEDIDVFLRN